MYIFSIQVQILADRALMTLTLGDDLNTIYCGCLSNSMYDYKNEWLCIYMWACLYTVRVPSIGIHAELWLDNDNTMEDMVVVIIRLLLYTHNTNVM